MLPICIAGRPSYRIVAERELADALAKLTDTDQRFETTWAHTRATKGDSTHIAMSTSRIRESLRRPARSIKPTEPPAPARRVPKLGRRLMATQRGPKAAETVGVGLSGRAAGPDDTPRMAHLT